MCLNPIKIKNPNYGLGHIGLLFMKDTTHRYMEVPCGHCPDCVAARQSALVQRVQNESRYSHMFFATLTYDNKHLPYAEIKVPPFKEGAYKHGVASTLDAARLYEERRPSSNFVDDKEVESLLENACADLHSDLSSLIVQEISPEEEEDKSDWKTIRMAYADIHHIQLLMKNLRDNLPLNGRKFSYICVSELGKTNGRPHFHVLFFLEKRPEDYSRGRVDRAFMYNLEKMLWQGVFKYWAINVGTRKHPVYEKLFTYRKRILGSKVFTNFDLHYVDPGLTTDGVDNVAYYVTKYLMKGSDKERRRQQFLALNLSPEDYHDFYNTIKCKLTISKGLGLDAHFYTVEKPIEVRKTLSEVAQEIEQSLEGDDLPPDDFSLTRVVYVKRRVMVPNFELCEEIRKNLARDAGKAPGPIFITPKGEHVPLAHYYQRFGYIYGAMDAMTIYFNFNPDDQAKRSELLKEEKDALLEKFERQKQTVERNSTFDTSPALLWGSDFDDNNRGRMALFGL